MITARNLKADRRLQQKNESHLLHSRRVEPTKHLLRQSYLDGCRTLIDFGCNGGEWKKITEQIGYEVTGVDHVQWDSVDVVHDCNDLTAFPSNSYECVQATEIIEHLETHPQKTFKELKRIAKRYLIISTPGASNKWGGIQAENIHRVEEINYHTHKWYIPHSFYYENGCIDIDLSSRWTVLRVRV